MARRYSDEFKKNALAYVEEHPDLDMRVCADYLGMPYDTLYGWYKRAHREKMQGSSNTLNSPLTEEEKEILRLKRELRDAKDALEVLKKAISILGE